MNRKLASSKTFEKRPFVNLIKLATLMAAIFFAPFASAQVNGYTRTEQNSFSWHPVESATFIPVEAFDIGNYRDDFTNVLIPFAFPFYNQTYTRVSVNTKGELIFGEGEVNVFNTQYPTTLLAAPSLAVY